MLVGSLVVSRAAAPPLEMIIVQSANPASNARRFEITTNLWQQFAATNNAVFHPPIVYTPPEGPELVTWLRNRSSRSDPQHPLLILGPTESDMLRELDTAHAVFAKYRPEDRFLSNVWFWAPQLRSPPSLFPSIGGSILQLGTSDRLRIERAFSDLRPRLRKPHRIGYIGVTNAVGQESLALLEEQSGLNGFQLERSLHQGTSRAESTLFRELTTLTNRIEEFWRRMATRHVEVVFSGLQHDLQNDILLSLLGEYNRSSHRFLHYRPLVAVLKQSVVLGDELDEGPPHRISQHTNGHCELWLATDLDPGARTKDPFLSGHRDLMQLLATRGLESSAPGERIGMLRTRSFDVPDPGTIATIPVRASLHLLSDPWRRKSSNVMVGSWSLPDPSASPLWPVNSAILHRMSHGAHLPWILACLGVCVSCWLIALGPLGRSARQVARWFWWPFLSTLGLAVVLAYLMLLYGIGGEGLVPWVLVLGGLLIPWVVLSMDVVLEFVKAYWWPPNAPNLPTRHVHGLAQLVLFGPLAPRISPVPTVPVAFPPPQPDAGAIRLPGSGLRTLVRYLQLILLGLGVVFLAFIAVIFFLALW